MKKSKVLIAIITTSFLFFSSTTGNGQNKIKNYLSKSGLIGKIKTITEIAYDSVDMNEEIKNKNYSYKMIDYINQEGNIIECEFYGRKSILSNEPLKTFYRYDDKGALIEKNVESRFGNKTNYYYDDQGTLIEEIYTGFSSGKKTFKYDNNGKKIEETHFNKELEINCKIIFKYDDRGNIIEDNDELYKYTYKYDNKGKKIEKAIYENGLYIEKHTYKYDNKGNIIEDNLICANNSFNNKYTYKYFYDVTGNWTKKTENKIMFQFLL